MGLYNQLKDLFFGDKLTAHTGTLKDPPLTAQTGTLKDPPLTAQTGTLLDSKKPQGQAKQFGGQQKKVQPVVPSRCSYS
jgi:hypothetical protein